MYTHTQTPFLRKGLMVLVALGLLASCQNEPSLSENPTQANREDYIKQGKKLENPYSILNMRLALENIKNRKPAATSKAVPVQVDPGYEIQPTHLYVKFDPKTIEEEAVIKRDTSRALFDYPLDYEFDDAVLDARPALRANEFPDYYAAIKINSDAASEAHYETLDQLYIPEEDPYFNAGGKPTLRMDSKIEVKKESLLNALLDEAYKITGNERNTTPTTDASARLIFGKRWWPSGTVNVWDNILNRFVPLQGAKILIRQWFTVRSALTDANGWFKTSSVRGSARYILQWERHDYSIRNGSFFQAETRGPKETNVAWNCNIQGGDDEYHAIIHQAAYDYYYGNRFDLISPPTNGFWKRQMKIAAREVGDGNDSGSYSHIRNELTFGLLSQIHIKAWGKNSDRVYGTTIHELAHSAHYALDPISYDNVVRDAFLETSLSVRNRNRRLLETWARTVEIVMSLERYKNRFAINNYEYYKDGFSNFQGQTILQNNHYTSAGFDMIDNRNQRMYQLFTRDIVDTRLPMDRVSGYTIKQLETGLIGATFWNKWRDNIKNRFANPTEQYLDELFNNWQD